MKTRSYYCSPTLSGPRSCWVGFTYFFFFFVCVLCVVCVWCVCVCGVCDLHVHTAWDDQGCYLALNISAAQAGPAWLDSHPQTCAPFPHSTHISLAHQIFSSPAALKSFAQSIMYDCISHNRFSILEIVLYPSGDPYILGLAPLCSMGVVCSRIQDLIQRSLQHWNYDDVGKTAWFPLLHVTLSSPGPCGSTLMTGALLPRRSTPSLELSPSKALSTLEWLGDEPTTPVLTSPQSRVPSLCISPYLLQYFQEFLSRPHPRGPLTLSVITSRHLPPSPRYITPLITQVTKAGADPLSPLTPPHYRVFSDSLVCTDRSCRESQAPLRALTWDIGFPANLPDSPASSSYKPSLRPLSLGPDPARIPYSSLSLLADVPFDCESYAASAPLASPSTMISGTADAHFLPSTIHLDLPYPLDSASGQECDLLQLSPSTPLISESPPCDPSPATVAGPQITDSIVSTLSPPYAYTCSKRSIAITPIPEPSSDSDTYLSPPVSDGETFASFDGLPHPELLDLPPLTMTAPACTNTLEPHVLSPFPSSADKSDGDQPWMIDRLTERTAMLPSPHSYQDPLHFCFPLPPNMLWNWWTDQTISPFQLKADSQDQLQEQVPLIALPALLWKHVLLQVVWHPYPWLRQHGRAQCTRFCPCCRALRSPQKTGCSSCLRAWLFSSVCRDFLRQLRDIAILNDLAPPSPRYETRRESIRLCHGFPDLSC